MMLKLGIKVKLKINPRESNWKKLNYIQLFLATAIRVSPLKSLSMILFECLSDLSSSNAFKIL